MQLLFDYPWYCILFCLLAGAGYSAALYGKTLKLRQVSKRVAVALSLLRFVTVSLIAFLLMAPLVKRNVTTHEKPIIVLAQDASESMPPIATDYAKLLDDNRFEVVSDTFGGKSTDIAAELTSISQRYAGRNLGAIVLASDGIFNQGQNPAIAAQQLSVPIYALALGDTTHHPDAAIAHTRCNRMAYLGNQFPIDVTVRAIGLKGRRAMLSVSRAGQRLWSEELRYDDNDALLTSNILLTADKTGLQLYTLTLSLCEGESSAANNSRSIAVEVLDGRQKIVIAAAAPHPDVSALRQAIEQNQNYEVAILEPAKLQRSVLKDYDLLICHNLPSDQQNLPSDIKDVPTLYIVGTQTNLGRFNALRTGIDVVARNRKNEEVGALRNDAFALFALDDDCSRRLAQLPPLTAPFGNYRLSAGVQPLFYAKVGNVATDRPLIAFSQQEGLRHSFVIGEGLWRWRLHDYLNNGNHNDFDQLIEKMVVFTSIRDNKERFHITHESIYREGDEVVLRAQFYNDNYEPVADFGSWTLSLRDSAGHITQHEAAGSQLTLPSSLGPGQYGYTAALNRGGKQYEAKGSFVIERLNLEQLSLVADHALLSTIAQTTGGALLSADSLDRLPEILAARDDIKTTIYSHISYTELLNLPWLFILLVILLGTEWALRKLFQV